MLPIHTILHPTDFSERSEFAFDMACALARDYGARLILLHVAARPVIIYGEGVVPPEPEDYQAEAKEKLYRLEAPDPRIGVEYRLQEGDPATAIIGEAEETNADLIVMGTHGRTGMRRLLMGSVAEQVVRKASRPVLTVRTPFPEALPSVQPAAELARS